MPTLKTVIRRAISRLGPSLGITVPLTGAAAQTVTAAELASGGLGAERYRTFHLLRLDAASSADMFRICSDYLSSTGVLTHDGAAYADTTATGESVDILHPSIEPRLLFNAAQEVVARIRRMDVTELPSYPGRYYGLGDLSWVEQASDVYMVTLRDSPVLSRNRHFARWGAYSSAGALLPDWWTLTGTSATIARGTSSTPSRGYPITLTAASGNTALLSQTVPLLDANGVESLRGKRVTLVLRARTAVAAALSAYISDGATTYATADHPGDGLLSELTVEAVIPESAASLSINVEMDEDGAATIEECYLVYGTLNDQVRRDGEGPGLALERNWVQEVPLAVQLDTNAFGQQVLVHTVRGYPQFDATRLGTRAALADSTDAPELTLAIGTAALVFRQLAERNSTDVEAYAAKAMSYMEEFEALAMAHLLRQQEALMGMVKFNQERSYTMPARRFGGRR